MNNGELPPPGQDQSWPTQYPTGADSWLGGESGLPRPSFPDVGRIPKAPFEIEVGLLGQTGKPTTYYEDLRPHAFFGKRLDSGVLIYPGLLITYMAEADVGTAVQEVWQPEGLTTSPLAVAAGAGGIICLKFTIEDYAITRVWVEVGTPQLFPAAIGGTCEVEIGTVTPIGFTQKLRSDFFYISVPTEAPP